MQEKKRLTLNFDSYKDPSKKIHEKKYAYVLLYAQII